MWGDVGEHAYIRRLRDDSSSNPGNDSGEQRDAERDGETFGGIRRERREDGVGARVEDHKLDHTEDHL